jgi:hypothetical protein
MLDRMRESDAVGWIVARSRVIAHEYGNPWLPWKRLHDDLQSVGQSKAVRLRYVGECSVYLCIAIRSNIGLCLQSGEHCGNREA